MGFDISFEFRDGYVFFAVAGEVTEEGLADLGLFVRDSCDAVDVNCALMDCKAMEGALAGVGLYRGTQEFIKAVGVSIKVAYINPPPHWNPEEDQFSRNVAYNRGGSLELFDSQADAEAWLKDGAP